MILVSSIPRFALEYPCVSLCSPLFGISPLPLLKEYHGERVVLATNVAQCTADNGTVCDPKGMKGEHYVMCGGSIFFVHSSALTLLHASPINYISVADNPLVNIRPVYNYPFPSENTFFWTDANCTQAVKVRQDGMMYVYPSIFHLMNVVRLSSTWSSPCLNLQSVYPSAICQSLVCGRHVSMMI